MVTNNYSLVLVQCTYLRPFLWSDFLACQEIWISNPTWSKTNHTKSGLGTLHCTVQFICTQKLDLHAIQLRGGTTSFEYHKSLQALVFIGWCCPGPGSSWGNLAVLPASKEAVSRSHYFHSIPPSALSLKMVFIPEYK